MNALELRRRTLGKGVYKKTVEGNPAIAQGSLARRYPGITMQGWTEQDGTPTPEAPVPIVSAGTQNQDTGKYEYEVKLTGANLVTLDKDSLLNVTGGKVVDVPKGVQFSFTKVRDCKGMLNLQFKRNTQYFIKFDAEIVETSDLNGVISNYKPAVVSKDSSDYYVGNVLSVTWKTYSLTNVAHVDAKFITPEDEDCSLYLFGNSFISGITGIVNITNFILSEVDVPYEVQKTPQTVTLTSDRPLTKWDKLEKRSGQWGWVYKSEEIESYTDESVPGEYFSTTGQLSTGAQVWYETTTETFVPLSESEQEQMNELYTFRPTTVLSNDCGCNMTLTYKTKKSLEVAT